MVDEGSQVEVTQAGSARMWEASRNGQSYGPYPESAIRGWIESGELAGDVMFSDGGPWITMAEFLGLETQRAEAEGRQVRLASEDIGRALPPPPPPDDTVHALPAMEDVPEHGAVFDAFGEPVQRDRIVVLGRRQSGKTIYLGMLYSTLWRSTGSLAAHSLNGTGHRELMTVADTVRSGQWPPATQASLRLDLELDYRDRKRRVVTLDFAGELFAKAFLMDQSQSPEVRPLLTHIDRAAAVMLLVDPAVVVSGDRQAFMEDDFGMVQAVRRLRSQPGGEDVPIVFVLTKADLHQEALDAAGGPAEFVRANFPTLVRMIKCVPIFEVSAVQSELDAAGTSVPRKDSQPIGIRKPLLYCLNEIAQMEQRQADRRQAAQDAEASEAAALLRQRKERWQNRLLLLLLVVIFLCGVAAVGAIMIYRW